MARFKHPPEMKRKALRMFKEGMTSYAVSVVLEISSSTAIRWQDEMGFGPDRRTPGARKRPIPDDLAQQAEYHGSLQRLCSHYHSSDSTVRRWLKESGIVLATRAPSDAKTPLPTWWEDAGKMTKAEIKAGADPNVLHWNEDPADLARQAVDPAREGREADTGLRQRKDRVRRRDDQVARERDLEAAAHRDPVDRRDHRLAEPALGFLQCPALALRVVGMGIGDRSSHWVLV